MKEGLGCALWVGLHLKSMLGWQVVYSPRNDNPGGGGARAGGWGGGGAGCEGRVSPESSEPQMSKHQNSENQVTTVLDHRNISPVTDAWAELSATSIGLWLPGPRPRAGWVGFGENVGQKTRMG